jgi:hypothetical protein
VTDPTTGGFADTPGPDATPDQDADVRALLAFLRDEPLEMPPDVAARLDAVIAEERRTAALATGTASATLDPTDEASSPLASVTVLPTLGERRGPSTRTFKIVGGVAAAALVVVGGVALAGSLGKGGGASTVTAADASSAASGGQGSAGVAISATGTKYAAASLASQASALVVRSFDSLPLGASVPASPAVPSPASAPATSTGETATRSAEGTTDATLAPTAFSLEKAASCVTALTDGDGSSAVAIDSGTFNGKAALVVVVTDPGDPASLRVFVTAPDCSPDFLQYQQIAKP